MAIGVLGGCPRGGAEGPDNRKRVNVRSFAEPSPVRLVVAAPPYLFSASERGLVRWELDSGQNLQLSAEHGLPGDRVEAMAYDVSRGWLWVATDGGVTRYDVSRGTFNELKAPDSRFGLDSFAGASLAAATDGGLWIGHRNGLFYASPDGDWREPELTEDVGAIMGTRAGDLWVAAESGVFVYRSSGTTELYSKDKGCDLERVRFAALTPSGGPMVVGENAEGEQRIIFILGDVCATYRASPNTRWLGAAVRRDQLVILTERGLYSAGSSSGVGARSLSRDGIGLKPVASNTGSSPPRSPYVFRPAGVTLPKGSSSIAAFGNEVFVGTRFLGTARLSYGDEKSRLGWLRRSDLVAGARSLSVACSDIDDCYIATGISGVWHFTGDSFTRERPQGSYTLAFARGPGGEIYAIARSADERAIELYRKGRRDWQRVRRATIAVPGSAPELSFARFAPSGELWLGLRYRDDNGEIQPYGLAVITIRSRSSKVAYHRASNGRDIEGAGWAVPLDSTDASFIDEEEVWLAASDGAVQVRDGKVVVHTEPEGTEGDIVRGVAVSSSGLVFVANRSGVSTYNGEEWAFPKPLKRAVTDVDVDRDGRLWMATNRGIAMFDGSRVHRLDVHRGLLQDQIDELAVDHFGRVWARGSQGLVLITP